MDKTKKLEEMIALAKRQGARRLTLVSLELTELPASLFDLEHLEFLNLERNFLHEVPADIVKLRNLVQLDVSDNYLTTLPSQMLSMPKLLAIDARNNLIEDLPPEFETMCISKLTQLDLRGCKLTLDAASRFGGYSACLL